MNVVSSVASLMPNFFHKTPTRFFIPAQKKVAAWSMFIKLHLPLWKNSRFHNFDFYQFPWELSHIPYDLPQGAGEATSSGKRPGQGRRWQGWYKGPVSELAVGSGQS